MRDVSYVNDGSRELSVLTGALLELGYAELAEFAIAVEPWSSDEDGPWGVGLDYDAAWDAGWGEDTGRVPMHWGFAEFWVGRPDAERLALMRALVLAHQVHDASAHLDETGEPRCQRCDDDFDGVELGVGPAFPCTVCGEVIGDDPNVGTLNTFHAACADATLG